MSEPYLAQIQMFGFNFNPRGWASCDGQLLPIAQNQALFSLLGTIYGGDGRTTFALPDLRGRVPLHTGNGPGLTSRREGQRSGNETVTLNTDQLPSHEHPFEVPCNFNTDPNSDTPEKNFLSFTGNQNPSEIYHTTSNATMGGGQTASTGGGQAHNNMPPFLVIRYCIALVGVFPSRS